MSGKIGQLSSVQDTTATISLSNELESAIQCIDNFVSNQRHKIVPHNYKTVIRIPVISHINSFFNNFFSYTLNGINLKNNESSILENVKLINKNSSHQIVIDHLDLLNEYNNLVSPNFLSSIQRIKRFIAHIFFRLTHTVYTKDLSKNLIHISRTVSVKFNDLAEKFEYSNYSQDQIRQLCKNYYSTRQHDLQHDHFRYQHPLVQSKIQQTYEHNCDENLALERDYQRDITLFSYAMNDHLVEKSDVKFLREYYEFLKLDPGLFKQERMWRDKTLILILQQALAICFEAKKIVEKGQTIRQCIDKIANEVKWSVNESFHAKYCQTKKQTINFFATQYTDKMFRMLVASTAQAMGNLLVKSESLTPLEIKLQILMTKDFQQVIDAINQSYLKGKNLDDLPKIFNRCRFNASIIAKRRDYTPKFLKRHRIHQLLNRLVIPETIALRALNGLS
ncbi:MAG: hypothetical protein JHC93_00890 [Parachlamydiales bacterium]|nr:hypothetical protein [Parachlamydiales bacterium]